jgi:hypothetical protein
MPSLRAGSKRRNIARAKRHGSRRCVPRCGRSPSESVGLRGRSPRARLGPGAWLAANGSVEIVNTVGKIYSGPLARRCGATPSPNAFAERDVFQWFRPSAPASGRSPCGRQARRSLPWGWALVFGRVAEAAIGLRTARRRRRRTPPFGSASRARCPAIAIDVKDQTLAWGVSGPSIKGGAGHAASSTPNPTFVAGSGTDSVWGTEKDPAGIPKACEKEPGTTRIEFAALGTHRRRRSPG